MIDKPIYTAMVSEELDDTYLLKDEDTCFQIYECGTTAKELLPKETNYRVRDVIVSKKEEFIIMVELLEQCRQILQQNNWRGDIQERINDALEIKQTESLK